MLMEFVSHSRITHFITHGIYGNSNRIVNFIIYYIKQHINIKMYAQPKYIIMHQHIFLTMFITHDIYHVKNISAKIYTSKYEFMEIPFKAPNSLEFIILYIV